MSGGEGRIFPLMNRNTPVLDRVRQRRNGADVSKTFGKQLGNVLLTDSTEEKSNKLAEMSTGIQEGMAQEFGVDPSQMHHQALELVFSGQSFDPEDMVKGSALDGEGVIVPVDKEEQSDKTDQSGSDKHDSSSDEDETATTFSTEDNES